MYYTLDMWKQKKQYALELYLQGKSPAVISGLTGVPRIRIERELHRITDGNPHLLELHMAAKYPSRRRLMMDVDPSLVLGAV